MSSMITATTWVPRGHAAQFPRRYEFDEAEYERIAGMTAQALEDAREDAREAGAQDGEENGLRDGAKKDKKSKKSKKGSQAKNDDDSADEDNDLKEFDLEHYDDDETENLTGEDGEHGGDAMGMFGSVKNLAYHSSNTEDPYITLPAQGENGEDDEEREELQILPTDNLVLAARVEDEVAHLEVYVYEDGEDNLYVHHDVMLPAIPLAVEWINVPVGDKSQNSEQNGQQNGEIMDTDGTSQGNFVAVGTLDPDIEVWDLDTVDCMYPAAILGSGHASSAFSALGTGKKKKKAKKTSSEYHTDAVLALAANRAHRNLLASGSADRTVKLWDLNSAGSTGKAAQSYDKLHTDKVCSLAWHTTETTALLSGGYDKAVVASDMRAPDAGARRWRVDSDVESVRWDPHDANFFYVACESGMLYYFDARKTPAQQDAKGSSTVSSPVWRLQAHDGPVSSFDANPIVPGFLATGSGDKTVKLWNVPAAGSDAKGPSMVVSRDLDVGRVFSTSFAPDREVGFRLAVAGSAGNLQIWDTSTNKAVRQAFAGRVPKSKSAEEEIQDRLVGLTVDDESSSDEGEDEDEGEEEREGGWEDGVEDEDDDEEDDEDEEMSE